MDRSAQSRLCSEINLLGVQKFCNFTHSSQPDKTQKCQEKMTNICRNQVAVMDLQQDMIRFSNCAAKCSVQDSDCFRKCQN